MNSKLRLVTTLLRVYPLSWRTEYGSELEDILLSRPLSLYTIADVFWNGLRQRAHVAEAAALCGLAAMLVILIGFAWNITAPPASANSLVAVLRESSKALPTLIVAPMASDAYVLLLLACGFWSRLREDGSRSQSGVAAMRLSAIAGLPVVLVGILMLTGVLGVVVLGPGDRPTTLP